MQSEYMYWAKMRSTARFNLATSGVAQVSRAELPVRIEDLEINDADEYGYEPLISAVASKHQVADDCVVTATGTSGANHLAMSALLGPGDEVAIEAPAYEPLLALASHLGASIVRFPRRRQLGFGIDPGDIQRVISPRTRLIVITNLHNPSSAMLGTEQLEAIGAIAETIGAFVLVDEVYLEAAFGMPRDSAFHLGPVFVVTGSLTKAYGLGGLRCGWVLAEPALAGRMWRLNDLFGVVAPHAADRISTVAVRHLDRLEQRARALLDRNRSLLHGFLASRQDIEAAHLDYGTTCFPRLLEGDAEAFCRLARERFETSVVPGSFFEAPEHFRIGIGGPTDEFSEALERLGDALNAWSRGER
jgi:hypothetical protein